MAGEDWKPSLVTAQKLGPFQMWNAMFWWSLVFWYAQKLEYRVEKMSVEWFLTTDDETITIGAFGLDVFAMS